MQKAVYGLATGRADNADPAKVIDAALPAVGVTKILDKMAELFGLRRLWLDGIGAEIYDPRSCYKEPERFFQDLIDLEQPASYPVSAIIDCERLDMHGEEPQNVVIVLSETLTHLEDREICRYTVYQDGMHWDYWKCRHQLKAMARVYHEATGKIVRRLVVAAEDNPRSVLACLKSTQNFSEPKSLLVASDPYCCLDPGGLRHELLDETSDVSLLPPEIHAATPPLHATRA